MIGSLYTLHVLSRQGSYRPWTPDYHGEHHDDGADNDDVLRDAELCCVPILLMETSARCKALLLSAWRFSGPAVFNK